MKEESNITESFDDIIFHQRNKTYGAYYLRKSYFRSMLPGIIIIVTLPFLLFAVQYFVFLAKKSASTDEISMLYQISLNEQMKNTPFSMQNLPPKGDQLKLRSQPEHNLVPTIVDSVKRDNFEMPEKQKDTTSTDSESNSDSGFGFPDGDENGSYQIYYDADTLPEFPGGQMALMHYLVKNIRYPEMARKKNIVGTVYLVFCVKNDGSIEKVQVHKSVDPLIDDEAVRVVKAMPKWKPGRIRNKNVNVMFMLPINFNLGNSPRS